MISAVASEQIEWLVRLEQVSKKRLDLLREEIS